MEDSTESPTDAQDGQNKIQLDPELEIQPVEPVPPSEFNSSPSSKTPDLGVAGPAPKRVHVKRPFIFPRRGYFDVRDESKVEFVMNVLDLFMFVATLAFFGYSFVGTEERYITAYSSLLTVWNILRLFYKWYRVQGGFDTFASLLGDFQPGVLALIFSLWGNNWKVILAVNVFSICFDFMNLAIQWFPSYIKIPIKGNVKKFLRADRFRDRYEALGISGLLPCNEATNEILISDIDDGEYYTLRKVDLETPINDVLTPVRDAKPPATDVETPAPSVGTPASLSAKKERNWIIGTMMVSYSDNGKWVTINQKAEERAVKTFMERFTEVQKCNFIRMMKAWKKRPSQGIVKKIGRRSAHCFTLARLIDLTKHGFSVYSEKTNLRRIKVGAEVDTGVEDFIDSIWEVLEVVYNRAAQQKSIIVAIIAVVVVFNLSTV